MMLRYGATEGEEGKRALAVLHVYATNSKPADEPQSNPRTQLARLSRNQDYSDQGQPPERLQAIDRLTGLSDQYVVDSLKTALHSDSNPAVRRRAAVALEDIGGDPAANALEAGLGDDNPSIRIAVVTALGRIGSERAIMAIGQTIMGDPEPETRRAAVLALAGHEGGAVEAFLNAARKDDARVVREAAKWVRSR